jgi:hypothetical protein
MPSNIMRHTCKVVLTQVRKYLNFRDLGLPALTAFVVIWVTFGIVLLFYHVVPYFGFAILLQFGASLFLFDLMLSSRLLLPRERFQLLDIVPAANAHSDIAESYTKCAAKANRLPVRGLDLLQLATSLVLVKLDVGHSSFNSTIACLGLLGWSCSLCYFVRTVFLHVEEHDKKVTKLLQASSRRELRAICLFRNRHFTDGEPCWRYSQHSFGL